MCTTNLQQTSTLQNFTIDLSSLFVLKLQLYVLCGNQRKCGFVTFNNIN